MCNLRFNKIKIEINNCFLNDYYVILSRLPHYTYTCWHSKKSNHYLCYLRLFTLYIFRFENICPITQFCNNCKCYMIKEQMFKNFLQNFRI